MMSYETALKSIPEGFADTVNNASREELEKIVVASEQYLKEINETEENDAQLAAARELSRDLGAGYRDAKKALQAKIVVALSRHAELGGS